MWDIVHNKNIFLKYIHLILYIKRMSLNEDKYNGI